MSKKKPTANDILNQAKDQEIHTATRAGKRHRFFQRQPEVYVGLLKTVQAYVEGKLINNFDSMQKLHDWFEDNFDVPWRCDCTRKWCGRVSEGKYETWEKQALSDDQKTEGDQAKRN